MVLQAGNELAIQHVKSVILMNYFLSIIQVQYFFSSVLNSIKTEDIRCIFWSIGLQSWELSSCIKVFLLFFTDVCERFYTWHASAGLNALLVRCSTDQTEPTCNQTASGIWGHRAGNKLVFHLRARYIAGCPKEVQYPRQRAPPL